MDKNDNHLVFRIVEYGRRKKFFTINELSSELNLDMDSTRYLRQTLICRSTKSDNINHLIVMVHRPDDKLGAEYKDDWIYTILPNAIVQYVDYLEIVEARKMASDANRNANMALMVTVYAVIISIILGLAQIFFQVADVFR